jgi:hypothetical protein
MGFMEETVRRLSGRVLAAAMCLAVGTLAGCSFFSGEKKEKLPPMEFSLESPYSVVRTLAVAPAINLSPSRDFDPLKVSDTLYEEMQQVRDLNVLPLNKTLLAMRRLGIRDISDAKSAQKLVEALGADGLVIPAVTAYDPYNPPMVGMILQLYTPASDPLKNDVDAPLSRPETLHSNPANPTVVADVAGGPQQPVSQVSAVFNAGNQTVVAELKVFADGRAPYDSALSERTFLLDADEYMRFVCHAMVRRLMDVERIRVSDR